MSSSCRSSWCLRWCTEIPRVSFERNCRSNVETLRSPKAGPHRLRSGVPWARWGWAGEGLWSLGGPRGGGNGAGGWSTIFGWWGKTRRYNQIRYFGILKKDLDFPPELVVFVWNDWGYHINCTPRSSDFGRWGQRIWACKILAVSFFFETRGKGLQTRECCIMKIDVGRSVVGWKSPTLPDRWLIRQNKSV